jgi:hypothetical protein
MGISMFGRAALTMALLVAVKLAVAADQASLPQCIPMPRTDPKSGLPHPAFLNQPSRWKGSAVLTFVITKKDRVESPAVRFTNDIPPDVGNELHEKLLEFARKLRYAKPNEPCRGALVLTFQHED